MSVYTTFRVVDDSFRKLAQQGKWQDVIAAISIGRTIMIPAGDAKIAANALSQAMRSRGFKLHRKTGEFEGSKGCLFWADKTVS